MKWIPECLVVLVKQRREVYGETKEVTELETKAEKDTRTKRHTERNGGRGRTRDRNSRRKGPKACTHLYSRTYN